VAIENEIARIVTEVKGKFKEIIGIALGNERLRAEGRRDQSRVNLQRAGNNIRKTFRRF
jgi:uncharacterized protein YjbJ (UPF0337 family)